MSKHQMSNWNDNHDTESAQKYIIHICLPKSRLLLIIINWDVKKKKINKNIDVTTHFLNENETELHSFLYYLDSLI